MPITHNQARVIAAEWARLMVLDRRPVIDGLLAATAVVHNLVLVTRNAADFQGVDLAVQNPFS